MGYIMDLRKQIGHQPLLMPCACVIVENEKGEVLLQRRKDNGLWCYAGGSVELDECQTANYNRVQQQIKIPSDTYQTARSCL